MHVFLLQSIELTETWFLKTKWGKKKNKMIKESFGNRKRGGGKFKINNSVWSEWDDRIAQQNICSNNVDVNKFASRKFICQFDTGMLLFKREWNLIARTINEIKFVWRFWLSNFMNGFRKIKKFKSGSS